MSMKNRKETYFHVIGTRRCPWEQRCHSLEFGRNPKEMGRPGVLDQGGKGLHFLKGLDSSVKSGAFSFLGASYPGYKKESFLYLMREILS